MPERKHTGGTQEVRYTKEDDERIRNTDTDSSRAFKDALHSWQARKAEQEEVRKQLEAERKRMRNMILLFIFVLVVLATLLVMRFIQ